MQIFNQACDHIRLSSKKCSILRTLYTEPHRHYHNVDHIENLLTLAESEGKYDELMVFTILYHDAVYYPRSTFNEELSAALYVYHFRNDHDFANHDILQAIHASKNHLNVHNHTLPNWTLNFLDYDLAGLADSKTFDKNSGKIYREFKPFFDFNQFVEGRKNFFVNMLASKFLYWKHPQWEEPARDNIYRELKLMEKPADYYIWLESSEFQYDEKDDD